MRKPILLNLCLFASLATVLAACDSPGYVDNNGTRYYNANDVSTDTLPSGPYTKNGQYITDPDTATNTRDNRGSRLNGYGHDVNDDYHEPVAQAPVVYQASPVVYQDTYPAGSEVYSDGHVVYPDGSVVYPSGVTTTTTRTTIIQNR